MLPGKLSEVFAAKLKTPFEAVESLECVIFGHDFVQAYQDMLCVRLLNDDWRVAASLIDKFDDVESVCAAQHFADLTYPHT